MNKALDLNKLFTEQKKGKLLKKHLKFPMYGSIKYDGNYVTIIKNSDIDIQYITSGNHEYTHTEPTIFDLPFTANGVYLAERIAGKGLLGDRVRCNLRGPRGKQTSTGHTYKVHHYMELEAIRDGVSELDFDEVYDSIVLDSGIPSDTIVENIKLRNQDEVEAYLKEVVAQGYEGIMLKSPSWVWKATKSRTVELVKYKKRPTADLLVVGATEGTGKYAGMIGSLELVDSKGREVSVGSGMSDVERHYHSSHFIGKVVEVFYEQIMDTYIQPTFGDEYEGVLIREDKTREDID